MLIIFWGCETNELTWISIKNDTAIPIYVMPYSSDFTNADWIQPGVSDDFYSLNCDCLDGFTYFSHYYDSLITVNRPNSMDRLDQIRCAHLSKPTLTFITILE